MYPSAQIHTFLLGTYVEMKLVSHRRVIVSHNLNSARKCQNVFQSGCILLHSCQEYVKVLGSPHW